MRRPRAPISHRCRSLEASIAEMPLALRRLAGRFRTEPTEGLCSAPLRESRFVSYFARFVEEVERAQAIAAPCLDGD
jgi:hypothetical protein